MSEHLIFCSDLARRDSSGEYIRRIEGWCLATSPISALFLHLSDGQDEQVPLGFSRPDVRAAYPDYPRAEESGFGLASASTGLGDSAVTLLVKLDQQWHRVAVDLDTRAIQTIELGEDTRVSPDEGSAPRS